MFFKTPEFKVGVMVIVVAALIGVMSMWVAEGPHILGRTKRFWFDVEDASGLVRNGAVRVAGIKVGIIEDIRLVSGKARVVMLLNSDVQVTTSSTAQVRTMGILGDKYVEVIPGNPADPLLESGSQLAVSGAAGGVNEVMGQVSRITDSLGRLTDTLNKITSGEGDTAGPLGRIVHNIEMATADIKDFTGANKEKLNTIVDRFDGVTERLNRYFDEDGFSNLGQSLNQASNSLSRIDRSLRNVEEITDKLNRGEGTLGRLINDEETVNNLNVAVKNVNEVLGGARKLETGLDFHSEYLGHRDQFKTFVGLRIQPGLDRFYEVAVIADTAGVVTRTQEETSVGGGPTVTESTVRTESDKVKFTALFAKNFYDLTVKGGVIENRGGIGLDYHLFRDRLRLSIEAFGFDNVNVRSFARYDIFKGLYLIGGGDDLFSRESRSSTFLGAGLFMTNDDLKVLASKVSF